MSKMLKWLKIFGLQIEDIFRVNENFKTDSNWNESQNRRIEWICGTYIEKLSDIWFAINNWGLTHMWGLNTDPKVMMSEKWVAFAANVYKKRSQNIKYYPKMSFTRVL